MITAFLAKAFLTLFVVIDPLGLAPIFITLSSHCTPEERLQIARQALLVAALILLVFALVGPMLLHYLGITLSAFRVAAGILLFKIAIEMVFLPEDGETASPNSHPETKPDISIFPLAIPLIAGPGSLASMVILVGEADNHLSGLFLVLGVAVCVLLIAYVILWLSGYLAQVLGQTGINVVTRILGVLLTALAVQYIADGAIGLISS